MFLKHSSNTQVTIWLWTQASIQLEDESAFAYLRTWQSRHRPNQTAGISSSTLWPDQSQARRDLSGRYRSLVKSRLDQWLYLLPVSFIGSLCPMSPMSNLHSNCYFTSTSKHRQWLHWPILHAGRCLGDKELCYLRTVRYSANVSWCFALDTQMLFDVGLNEACLQPIRYVTFSSIFRWNQCFVHVWPKRFINSFIHTFPQEKAVSWLYETRSPRQGLTRKFQLL